MYNNGNFGLLREKASSIDWHALENDDISLYASNLNSLFYPWQKNVSLTNL